MTDETTGRRHPRAAATQQRIAPLASLPLFHRISGRKAVLVGTSDGALWKAELLAAAGAQLLVFAGSETHRFEPLATDIAARSVAGFGSIEIFSRAPTGDDLKGAAVAVADFEEVKEAEAFAALARGVGVPLNMIDKQHLCDVQFGSIVNRSPLIVSISTDGTAPVFGQAIRQRIEAMLPLSIVAWAEAARRWRPAIKALNLPFAQRRALWERFANLALGALNRAPTEADRDALLATLSADEASATGSVTLVGAGPGDPDLLTVKAIRAMQGADVILYDDLVTTEVLDLARREAQRIMVGKRGFGPSCKQSDINDLMVRLALEGKRVVRLKSGDPLIFGRASEEIDACRAHGVAVSVVPGVTAAQGAAAGLGLSLTERRIARRVQYVTGHGEDGTLPKDLDWSAIADASATTIVYMPRRSLGELAVRAMAAGLPAATPAVAFQSATRSDERRLHASIGDLAGKLKELPSDGPVMVIIGQVMRQRG